MQYKFRLHKVHCAGCALALEQKLNELEGVKASINFVTKLLVLDIETEKRIEYLIYDYNWIVNSFNDGKSLDVIPEAYSNLLKSVSVLPKNEYRLKVYLVFSEKV